MLKMVMKRGFFAILYTFLATVLIFFVFSSIPSDEFMNYMMGGATDARPSMEQLEQARETMGLNRPWYEQYFDWLNKALKGDFGTTIFNRRSVSEQIGPSLVNSLILNSAGMLLMFLLAIPIGIQAAVKKHTYFDHVISLLVVLGTSIPAFYFGLFFVYILATRIPGIPVSGMRNVIFRAKGYPNAMAEVLDIMRHMILPVSAIALSGVGLIIPYVRNSVIEALSQDYIQTARSKGLSKRAVLYKHAFRNSLIPLISLVSIMIPLLFIGNIFIEALFSWPGIGKLFIEALNNYSKNLLLATVGFFTIATVFGNFLSDALYAVADPRIRVK